MRINIYMTVIHSLNYLDITYNTNGTITISMINQLANMLGIQNVVSPSNLQNAINLLIKDYNFFTLMVQLDSLIKKHSDYDSAIGASGDSNSLIYDSNGDENTITDKFMDITSNSAHSFVTQAGQLLTLSNNLAQNSLLRNIYVSSTNKNINQKLTSFRSLLTAYSTASATDKTTTALNYDEDFTFGFCPLFSIWANKAVANGYTATTYESQIKSYITPLLGPDITFLRFFSNAIYLGIHNLISDTDNQNVIVNYGLDVLQIMDVLAAALDVPVFSTNDKTTLASDNNFLLFANTVQRILTLCVPIINDVKNKVLMNGLPSYYIVYCLFIICMLNNRNDMLTIASLNLNTLYTGDYGTQLYFYATGTADVEDNTSTGLTVGKTYSISGTNTTIETDNTSTTEQTITTTVYSVDLTNPTSNLLFVGLGFI